MKIAILSNHSYPMSGGSEKVIKQISESMSNKFGIQVDVFSKNVFSSFRNNNVNYIPLPITFKDLSHKINKNSYDHVFIYGDLFAYFQLFLENIDNFNCKKSVVLVGANCILKNHKLSKILRNNKDKINIVTHSNEYIDAKICRDWSIPYRVIPNAIDLNEFALNKDNNFKKDFNIKKKLVTVVSNFFPGKGQEIVPPIVNKLKNNITLAFIYSSVNYSLVSNSENKTKENIDRFYNHLDFLFLKDLKRKEVISAFMSSDVFLFPSKKEVAPLVVMEAMASKLPWISLPVGNTPDLSGGIIVPPRGSDINGYIYSPETISTFAEKLDILLEDELLRKKLGEEGRDYIEKNHDWGKVQNMYHELFTN